MNKLKVELVELILSVFGAAKALAWATLFLLRGTFVILTGLLLTPVVIAFWAAREIYNLCKRH